MGPNGGMSWQERRDRERYAIMFSSPERGILIWWKGYGLFAKKRIEKGEVIGLYTGIIAEEHDDQDNDYMWTYDTLIENRNKVLKHPGLDARKFGNYMRFVNDWYGGSKVDMNVVSVYVPYLNRWWILYVSIKEIAAGQELLTSYGEDYFVSRLKH